MVRAAEGPVTSPQKPKTKNIPSVGLEPVGWAWAAAQDAVTGTVAVAAVAGRLLASDTAPARVNFPATAAAAAVAG